MTHDATVELLSRYLDGDLSPGECEKAESLMTDDAGAREIYEGLRQVRGSLGQLADAAVPPHLGVLVQRRVALEAETSGLWQRVDSRLRRFLVEPAMLPAFAVVLALAAMVYVLASGLDRFERAREPVILRPHPDAVRVQGPREIAGRTFELQGDRWIEQGLTSEAAATAPRQSIAISEIDEWAQAHPALAEVAQLGAVVLNLDGSVVELVFERGDG